MTDWINIWEEIYCFFSVCHFNDAMKEKQFEVSRLVGSLNFAFQECFPDKSSISLLLESEYYPCQCFLGNYKVVPHVSLSFCFWVMPSLVLFACVCEHIFICQRLQWTLTPVGFASCLWYLWWFGSPFCWTL